ncbi:MAG TPA: carbohydrate kinase family protein [Candidatus Saccharimonadales bacterium]|nr:carbohydrate kinase family protein [Candidatus Saccharimonadales bacterium]
MIAAPDLLVVGGLSIDRFPDGSTAAGGSVLHAARAVAATGSRVATIVLAGGEPEAQVALTELADLGPCLLHRTAATTRFAIDERRAVRRLVLEAAGGEMRIAVGEVDRWGAAAVLLAPIAGELDASVLRAARHVPVRVAALQGWLRTLQPGVEVAPLRPRALSAELVAELRHLSALVASVEDLIAVGPSPDQQLDALRDLFGAGPRLIVTKGPHGARLDLPGADRLDVSAPRPLSDVPTVGAGDAFAALLTVQLGKGVDPGAAAAEAAMRVTELLDRFR